MDKQTKSASNVPTPQPKTDKKPTADEKISNDLGFQELEERVAPAVPLRADQ